MAPPKNKRIIGDQWVGGGGTFCSKLVHGRDEQLEQLRDLLFTSSGNEQQRNDNKNLKKMHGDGVELPRVVRVHGPSGCGKTTLCREFGQDAVATSSSVVFTVGKVDPLHRNFPFAVIIQALEGIASTLLRREDGQRPEEGDLSSCSPKNVDDENISAFSSKEYPVEEDEQGLGEASISEGRWRSWLVSKLLWYLGSLLLNHFLPRWVLQFSTGATAGPAATSELRLFKQNEETAFAEKRPERRSEDPVMLTPSQVDSLREVLLQSGNQVLRLLPQWARLCKAPAVNNDGSNLTASSLSTLTGDSLESVSERVILVILELMQLLAGMFKLVILLDDWQWVDAASLQLVSALARQKLTTGQTLTGHDSPTTTGIILLLVYRDDELNDNGNLAIWKDLPSHQVTDVPVVNLTLSELTKWIRALLLKQPVQRQRDNHFAKEEEDLTEKLAGFVHEQTKGNAYFVLTFLSWMQRQGRLTLALASSTWEWDDATPLKMRSALQECPNPGLGLPSHASSAGSPTSTTTVTCVVQCQLATLPRHVQSLLHVASCLGFYFHGILLQRLLEDSCPLMLMGYSVFVDGSPEMCSAIEIAQRYGLVERSGATPLYHFTHDRIQQTVYESIEPQQRKLLHLRIGQHIAAMASGANKDGIFDHAEQSNPYGFVDLVSAADQCNRGSSRLVHEEERLRLIELNLRASGEAKKRAGINLVADYLRKAVELMRADRDWEQNYRLSLEVMTQSAETEYARGRFGVTRECVAEILKHSRTFDDELRARFVSMQVLGAQCRFLEAIREAKLLLHQLGEYIPSVNAVNFLKERCTTSRMVKSMSDEELTNLPPVKNERRRWIAKILQAASVYGWNCDSAFAGLIFLRQMRTTLTHGSCEYTAWAYACYGLILAGMGQELEGYRFGKLAQAQVKDKTSVPGVSLVIRCNLMHLYQPAAQSLEPFLSAYRAGLDTGEMEFGSMNIGAYATLYIFCGLPLQPFVVDMRKFADQLRFCGMDVSLGYLLPMLQFALNLTGESKNPSLLTWDECKNEGICNESFSVHDGDVANLFLHYAAAFNAYILGDLELALQCAKRASFGRLPGTYFSNSFHVFIDGVVYLGLYRKTKSRKYLGIATRLIKQLTAKAKKGMVNCLGMLCLLQAEKTASLRGDVSDAKHLFDKAISQLSRTGFTHLAAIANERAGEFMLRCGKDKFWHQYYIGHAAALYDEWGAAVKTKSIVEKYPFVRLGTKPPTIKISLRGRTRFNENYDSANTTEDLVSASQLFS